MSREFSADFTRGISYAFLCPHWKYRNKNLEVWNTAVFHCKWEWPYSCTFLNFLKQFLSISPDNLVVFIKCLSPISKLISPFCNPPPQYGISLEEQNSVKKKMNISQFSDPVFNSLSPVQLCYSMMCCRQTNDYPSWAALLRPFLFQKNIWRRWKYSWKFVLHSFVS